MALSLETPTPAGVSGNYLRVMAMTITPCVNVRLTVGVYASSATCAGGLDPLTALEFTFIEREPIALSPLTYAYTKLKTLEQFQNAEDS